MKKRLSIILKNICLVLFILATCGLCFVACKKQTLEIKFKQPSYTYFRGDVADAYDFIEREEDVDYSFAFSYLTLSESGETISTTKAELQANTIYLEAVSTYTLFVTATKGEQVATGSVDFDVVGETPVLFSSSASLVYNLGDTVRVSVLLERASPTVIPASCDLVVDYYTHQESQAPKLDSSGNTNPKSKIEIDKTSAIPRVTFDKLGLYEFHVVAYNGDCSADATFKVKVLPDQKVEVDGVGAYKNAEFGEFANGAVDSSVVRLVGSPNLLDASYVVLEENFVEGQVARFEFYGRSLPYLGVFNQDYPDAEDPNCIVNGGLGYVFTMERATVANSARLYGFTRMSNATSCLRYSTDTFPMENFGFNDLEEDKHYAFEIMFKTTGKISKKENDFGGSFVKGEMVQDMAIFFSLYEINDNDPKNPYTIVAHSQGRYEGGANGCWFKEGEEVKGKLVAYSSISQDITFKYHKDTLLNADFDATKIAFDEETKTLSWDAVEGAENYIITTSDVTTDRFAILNAQTTSIDLTETYDNLPNFTQLKLNVFASIGNNVFSNKKYVCTLAKNNVFVLGEVLGYDNQTNRIEVSLQGTGAISASHFQKEVDHVAFTDNYVLDENGTYIDVYFTGNNMPQVEFFASDILGNVRNLDGATNKGFVVTNGHAYPDLQHGQYGGVSNYDTYFKYGVSDYNRIAGGYSYQLGARADYVGKTDDLQYNGDYIDYSLFSQYALEKQGAEQDYRYTVGMYKDEHGYVYLEAKLFKVAQNGTESLFAFCSKKVPIVSGGKDKLDVGETISGKIVLHAGFKGDSKYVGDNCYNKFSCSNPYAGETASHILSGKSTFNADGTVSLQNGVNNGTSTAITNDVGYIALAGEYGLGTYMDFYFTGSNLPQVSFFNEHVTNNFSAKYNGEDGANSGVLLINDMRHGSTIANNAYYRFTIIPRLTTTLANISKYYNNGSNSNGKSKLSASVLETMPDQRFKYTVGFYLGTDQNVYASIDVDKLDENGNKTEDYFEDNQAISLTQADIKGNRIIIYGAASGNANTYTTFRYSEPYQK